MKIWMLYFSLAIVSFMVSCENNNDKETYSELKTVCLDNMSIRFNTYCGWCYGNDSLYITSEETYYEEIINCGNKKLEAMVPTSKEDWNELKELLDFEVFRNIKLNTCYVCVDGCDCEIEVSDGETSHTIRFGYIEDSETIKPIKSFINKLIEIKEGFFLD